MYRIALTLPLAALLFSCGGSGDKTCFVGGCDASATASLLYSYQISYPLGPPAEVTAWFCGHHETDARDPESEISRGRQSNGMSLKPTR